MMLDNYAQNKKKEDGNLDRNELCTLDMEWSSSLHNFINLLLLNGYGVTTEPIFDENNKVDIKKLLITILDK